MLLSAVQVAMTKLLQVAALILFVKLPVEPLQATQLTSQGNHVIRYSRACNNFAKMVVGFLGDDERYAIVSKHRSAMQADLNALKKRRASCFVPEHQVDSSQSTRIPAVRQRKKICKEANASAAQGEPSEALEPRGTVYCYCMTFMLQ